jgi:hypothetical protein
MVYQEGSVSKLIRSGIVLVLAAGLISIPAMSATSAASNPLGMIMQADRAMVGVDTTMGGATVYDGDRLETDTDGTLRARLGGGPQIYLTRNSLAVVHGLSNGYSANLMHGTVIASSAEGQTFQILSDGVTIQPTNSKATTAQITWVNPRELLLTSTRGSINVSLGEEVKTIEAGSSYRMAVASDEADPQGPVHGGRNHLIFWVIIGVSAAAAIGIWRAVESPSR